MEELKRLCEKINSECLKRQECDKEVICDNDAFEAYIYIKNNIVEDTGDVLMFCTCLNLINTYVKQSQSKIGYGFKNEVGRLIKCIINQKIKHVNIDVQEEKKTNVVIIEIYDVQFSFHNVHINENLRNIVKNNESIVWDKIRKQQCAKTIYDIVKINKNCKKSS